ncbi:MAG: hypothetical protein JO314_12375 [Acidobacteria bacterium]|nr:hypothetical protein [Acidobacteriota bacterium]
MPMRLAAVFAVVLGSLAAISAQAVQGDNKPITKAKATPVPTPQKLDPKTMSAEQAAEVSILAYGVRERLNQIRKTTLEVGTTSYTGADGKTDTAKYQRFIIRGDTIGKEKIRLDQQFSNARYSLLYNSGTISGVYDNTVFTPRDDVAKAFENQIVHGIETLLRYKENGSTVAIASRDKVMGVDYIILDVTDKQDRKTRFYVSTKTYRVMILEYDEGGVHYKRKFYDYNYAQGTLVPFRTVLWANDKQVEETNIGTVTFGQKVDDGLFNAG